MALTTSKDILEAVGQGGGPRRMLVTLGYSAGRGTARDRDQAKRLADRRAKDAIIFDTPVEEPLARCDEAARVDFAKLSERQGTREPGGSGPVQGLRPNHTRF